MLPHLSRHAAVAVCIALSGTAAASQDAPLWHELNFRYLPQANFSLVSWVTNLPRYDTFVPMDSTRQARFGEFVDALLTAVAASLRDGASGDWCDVRARADAAGYGVKRVFETEKKRWMVYAYDGRATGQPYFFISPNPNPQRDVVLEAPHNTYDRATGRLAAQLFLDVNGRAFILNKAYRCAGSAVSSCSGTSRHCGGVWKVADSAHADTQNAFQIIHARLNDRWRGSRFAQVHGFSNLTAQPDVAELSDGTSNDIYGDGNAFTNVSMIFAGHLTKYIPSSAHSGVWACEAIVGSPPNQMCGTHNTQGRYSNGNDATYTTTSDGACRLPEYNYTGRFLHVETGREFRDDDNTDGMYWRDVSNALKDTWACTLNTATPSRDCAMTTQSNAYPDLSCP